jgi:hypothetical protein
MRDVPTITTHATPKEARNKKSWRGRVGQGEKKGEQQQEQSAAEEQSPLMLL